MYLKPGKIYQNKKIINGKWKIARFFHRTKIIKMHLDNTRIIKVRIT